MKSTILFLTFLMFASPAFADLECFEIFISSPTSLEPHVSSSQAERILFVLSRLTPEQRSRLFATLGEQNLPVLLRNLKHGEVPPQLSQVVEEYPGLEVILLDLLSFGDAFPRIFAQPNADSLISQVLGAVRTRERNLEISNPDLLKSQVEAPRLARTIDNTLVNLILRANAEYLGSAFGRSGVSRLWAYFGRLFSPHYAKVVELIDFSQTYQRQLTRLRMIDELAIELGLAEGSKLQLTQNDVERLTALILDSPAEISEIENVFRNIFHSSFASGSAVEIADIQIDECLDRSKRIGVSNQVLQFDASTIKYLAELNSILNTARARISLPERTVKELDKRELQLLVEARSRHIVRLSRRSSAILQKKSKEEYKVERRYYELEDVDDGFDEKGNPKTVKKLVPKFREDEVTPTIGNILDNEFDEGDKDVEGLEEIKSRTSRLRARENPYREIINRATNNVNLAEQNYSDFTLKGFYVVAGRPSSQITREQVIERLHASRAELEGAIGSLREYQQLPLAQIRAQYANDIESNFRQRNEALIFRYENMIIHLTNLAEIMRRNIIQRTPSFDDWDYSTWLVSLRRRRNIAYTQITLGSVGLATAGGTYVFSPEFHETINSWVGTLLTPITAALRALGY